MPFQLVARAGRAVAARIRRETRRRTLAALVACAAFYLSTATTGLAAFHYVAVDGRSDASGTIDDPWDLQTALTASQIVVVPGDTVWLRGGTYSGSFVCTLTAAAETPVIVRAYPGERVILDGEASSSQPGVLQIKSRYIWFWGLEIMSSDAARYSPISGNSTANISRPVGVSIGPSAGDGHGCRFINLIIHDTAEGHWFSIRGTDSEVYGNIIYNNGWIAPDRAHGHGIYVRNESGRRTIAENVIFNQFGFGIHGWTDSAQLLGIDFEGNVSFNNGALAGKYWPNLYLSSGAVDCQFLDNLTYYSGLAAPASSGSTVGDHNALVMTGNVFAAPGNIALTLGAYTGYRYIGENVLLGDVVGLTPAELAGNEIEEVALPAVPMVFVRRNLYENGLDHESTRGHVIIYNWGLAPTVTVDLSTVLAPGQPFEIRDAQNYWGAPFVAGTYGGGDVTIPMNLTTVAAPIGVGENGVPIATPPHTAPEFAALVVTSPPTDGDADGVPEIADVCALQVAPGGTDLEGRPLGDLDRDCIVSAEDVALFDLCRRSQGAPSPPECPSNVNADLDGDGDVDTADFAILARNFVDPSAVLCPGVVAPAGFNEFGRPLGDMNRDCKVNTTDFGLFAGCFSGSGAAIPGTCADANAADLDSDGDVDLADFAIFAANFSG